MYIYIHVFFENETLASRTLQVLWDIGTINSSASSRRRWGDWGDGVGKLAEGLALGWAWPKTGWDGWYGWYKSGWFVDEDEADDEADDDEEEKE